MTADDLPEGGKMDDAICEDVTWPREIWAEALAQNDHDGHYVLSLASTVSRWEGDREGPFQRYVDADIYESAERYYAARLEAQAATIARLTAALNVIARGASITFDRNYQQMSGIEARDIARAALSATPAEGDA